MLSPRDLHRLQTLSMKLLFSNPRAIFVRDSPDRMRRSLLALRLTCFITDISIMTCRDLTAAHRRDYSERDMNILLLSTRFL